MPISPSRGSDSQLSRSERRESDCRPIMHDDRDSEGSSAIGPTEQLNGMEVDTERTQGRAEKEVRFNEAIQVHDEPQKGQDYYFNYYSSLQNQANMIGDIGRTGTYRKAILGNSAVAFKDKAVLDVGAGSGVLSFLSAQAGAKSVIALEASSMAENIKKLVSSANRGFANSHLKGKVRVVRGMVEDQEVQHDVLKTGKVDTIVSEPIGVMLFHERMVESFLLARDLFLKPGGNLLPSSADLTFVPFSDDLLYSQTDQKAQFFNQTLFGTDFSELYEAARKEIFAQPVVGPFATTSLVGTTCTPRSFDFRTIAKDSLLDFRIQVDFTVTRTSLIHGVASWFDLYFQPNPQTVPESAMDSDDMQEAWQYAVQTDPNDPWALLGQSENYLNPSPPPEPLNRGLDVTLTTSPYKPRTHWQQARLLIPEPLAANKGERIVGSVHFKANDARSYDITADLCIDRPGPSHQPNPLQRKGEYALQQQTFN